MSPVCKLVGDAKHEESARNARRTTNMRLNREDSTMLDDIYADRKYKSGGLQENDKNGVRPAL
jgi:hypothetical protein